MIAYSDFITAFPEFSNASTYPMTQVDFWIPVAYQQLNACTLGTSLDLAAMLFVAHNIVLSARSAAAASIASDAPGSVGNVQAPISSKSVGGASMSYDVGSVTIDGAGIWNATSYGQRLYKLMQSFSGAIYVPSPRARWAGYGYRSGW